MATQPDPLPDEIDPQFPEETPSQPDVPVPELPPEEAPDLPPDIAEPDGEAKGRFRCLTP